MMRVKAKQAQVWEREDLEQWFATTFPERVIGKPKDEVAAYLDDRGARAGDLGFTRPSHLRFLIGYEIGCGVLWREANDAGDAESEGPSAPVIRVLRQRDLDPEQRIEAAERLLYGDSDD